MDGSFIYGATSLTPPGKGVLTYVSVEEMRKWVQYALEVVPAMEHHRCHKVYNKETRGIKIVKTIIFKPHTYDPPFISTTDIITTLAAGLFSTLKTPPNAPHYKTLEDLQRPIVLKTLLQQTMSHHHTGCHKRSRQNN